MFTKRLSRSKEKVESFQKTLSTEQIREKLKDYMPVSDPTTIPIGTHVRYFVTDPKTNQKNFRLGGQIRKVDPEGRFLILSNGAQSWSAQIGGNTYWKKMSSDEIRDQTKRELQGGRDASPRREASPRRDLVGGKPSQAELLLEKEKKEKQELMELARSLKKELEQSKKKIIEIESMAIAEKQRKKY
jgi:hypothetical protein